MENARIDLILKRIIFWTMAVMLTVMPLVFNAYFIDAFNLPKVALLRTAVLLALGAWAARVAISQPVLRRTRLDLPVIIFLGAAIVSTIFSINPFHSFWGQHMFHFEGLSAVLSYVLLFFVVVNNLDLPEVNRLLRYIVYGAIPVVAYGIIQSAGYDFVHWQISPSQRIWSTFGNPNFFAGYLVMILPLALSFLITIRGPGRIGMGSIFLGGLYCLFYTYSRAGAVGLLVSGIVFLTLAGSTRVRKYLWASISIIIILLVAITLTNTLHGDADVESLKPRTGAFATVQKMLTARFNAADLSIQARLHFANTALRMFAQRPITGYGPDAFSIVWRKYMTKDIASLTGNRLANPAYAHSEFLQTLGTMGILGAGAYIFLLFSLFVVGRRTIAGNERMVPVAIISSLAGIIATNQFSFHSPATAAYFWFFAAAIAVWAGTADTTVTVKPALKFTALIVTLMIILAGLTYTAKACVGESAFPKGLFLESKGRFDAAIEYYNKAIKAYPFEHTYYQNLAKAYITRADVDQNTVNKKAFLDAAVLVYQRHLALIPQDTMSWNGMGIAEMKLAELTNEPSHYAKAETAFRASIRTCPAFLEPYINLGSQLYMSGHKADALAVYKTALAIDNREPLIYFNLGNMFAQEGDMQKAVSYWQDALDLNPNYNQARENIELSERTKRRR